MVIALRADRPCSTGTRAFGHHTFNILLTQFLLSAGRPDLPGLNHAARGDNSGGSDGDARPAANDPTSAASAATPGWARSKLRDFRLLHRHAMSDFILLVQNVSGAGDGVKNL